MTRRVSPLPDGSILVELPTEERDLLRSLPDELRPILSGDHEAIGATGVRERLFPRAYDDPDDDADYRELVQAELAEERLAALEAFAQTLGAGSKRLLTWHVALDREQAESWLSATNDARLVLAMIVGIASEEDWERGPDPGDPAATVLWYLGWLQEELLAALPGSEATDGT